MVLLIIRYIYADDIQIYTSCKVSDMVSSINTVNTQYLWLTQSYITLNNRLLQEKTYLLTSLFFCCQLFDNSDFESKRRMRVLFNKITRYSLNIFTTNVSILSKQLFGMSLDHILLRKSLTMLHKIIYSKEPKYLSTKSNHVQNCNKNIVIPKIINTIPEHQFLVHTVCQWNALPSNIQFISVSAKFKTVF